jgi:HlyD family secretion protein
LAYRALIALKAGAVESQGQRLKLTPGMQVAAEIHLGRRSVLE